MSGADPRQQLASSLVLVATLLALGLVFLRPGATHSARPMSDVDPGAPGFPVRLSVNESRSDGEWRHASGLVATRSNLLRDAGEIRFFVGTYGATPEAREFVIRESSSGAILFARDPGKVENNAEVRLRKIKSPGDSTGELRLEVVFRGGDDLAVWAQIPGVGDDAADRNLIVSAGDQRGIIWGTWFSGREVSPVSRLALLDAMWDHSVIARITGVLGLLLLTVGVIGGSRLAGRIQMVLLFAGISLIYALVVPPFQAPDEPDHFLTLAGEVGGEAGKDLADSALRLANNSHFESIKFRPAVKFAAEDIGRPEGTGWASHVTPTGSQALRSPLAALLWPTLGRVISGFEAADALMMLRVLNIVLLASAFFVCLNLAPAADSSVVAAFLLMIPTLPFFGLHFSNHALPLAATVAATGMALRAAGGNQLRSSDYPLWGALSGLAFVAGVTGIATMAVMAGLAWVAAMGTSGKMFRDQIRLASAYTGGALAVIFCVILAVSGQEYLVDFINRIVRWWTGPVGTAFRFSPFLVIPGLALAWIGSVGLLSMSAKAFSKGWGKVIWLVAGVWFVFLALSLFHAGPVLPGIEGGEIPDIPIGKYGRLAVGAFLSGFGLGAGDSLVVRSFWGGFGWLDAFPPDWLVRGVKLMPTLGISLLLLDGVARRDAGSGKVAGWVTVVTFLTCAAVAALAFSTHRINVNLHGRYLAGLYVIFTAVCGLGASRRLARCSDPVKNASRQAMIVAVLFIHSTCWCSLALRYLGSS